MQLSHPVRACDEAIYFKFPQKSIATKPTIVDMIKAFTVLNLNRDRSHIWVVFIMDDLGDLGGSIHAGPDQCSFVRV